MPSSGWKKAASDWISPVAVARRLAEPGLVEGADRRQRDQVGRRRRGVRRAAGAPGTRSGSAAARPVSWSRVACSPRAEHRAAHRATAGEGVDPGDRVGVVAGRTRDISRITASRSGSRWVVTDGVAGLDRDRVDDGAEDDAGQAHPADGRPEEVARRCPGRWCGCCRRRAPGRASARGRRSCRSRWWLLPCTSQAIAPPTVT